MQFDVFLISLWQLFLIELFVLIAEEILKILLEKDTILSIIILLERWNLLFIEKCLSFR